MYFVTLLLFTTLTAFCMLVWMMMPCWMLLLSVFFVVWLYAGFPLALCIFLLIPINVFLSYSRANVFQTF